jgi:hypothetical protein
MIRRYLDDSGHQHELIARPAHAGSTLLVDRDLSKRDAERLVAHIAADEPPGNVSLMCQRYLEADDRQRRCRPVLPDDELRAPPSAEPDAQLEPSSRSPWPQLEARDARLSLARITSRMSIPELRWARVLDGCALQPLSLREVVAALESYEPSCAITRRALARHARDAAVSCTVLRAELARVSESPIVLNRALREAVLVRVARQQTSMSEIALRCGRFKRDSRGNVSGETSWLARRIGLLPEGGQQAPTRWIHSDVLGLIARQGLGICPREVELG